jgi:hypothetical protein
VLCCDFDCWTSSTVAADSFLWGRRCERFSIWKSGTKRLAYRGTANWVMSCEFFDLGVLFVCKLRIWVEYGYLELVYRLTYNSITRNFDSKNFKDQRIWMKQNNKSEALRAKPGNNCVVDNNTQYFCYYTPGAENTAGKELRC